MNPICTGAGHWPAVAVGLGPTSGWLDDESNPPTHLVHLLPAPNRIPTIRERNIQGQRWELPGIDTDKLVGLTTSR